MSWVSGDEAAQLERHHATDRKELQAALAGSVAHVAYLHGVIEGQKARMIELQREADGLRRAITLARDILKDWECPAGGAHEWGMLEQAGTGHRGLGCESCGASRPEGR